MQVYNEKSVFLHNLLHISTTRGQYRAGIVILMREINLLDFYLFQLYPVITVNL